MTPLSPKFKDELCEKIGCNGHNDSLIPIDPPKTTVNLCVALFVFVCDKILFVALIIHGFIIFSHQVNCFVNLHGKGTTLNTIFYIYRRKGQQNWTAAEFTQASTTVSDMGTVKQQ